MFSPSNLYFARRPEVSQFPLEIVQKICLEANRDMHLCNECHNFMEFTCNICNECSKCKYGNFKNGRCNDHHYYFCEFKDCERIVPVVYRENHMTLCIKHETKCYKCGNVFSDNSLLNDHITNYHKRIIPDD